MGALLFNSSHEFLQSYQTIYICLYLSENVHNHSTVACQSG